MSGVMRNDQCRSVPHRRNGSGRAATNPRLRKSDMTSDPQKDDPSGLFVRFWGTRGSIPVPGPDTVVFGGQTCCVEVRLGTRLFIIDAGSGFEAAGRMLSGPVPQRLDLLLSHLHHDHIAGLPFFTPILTGRCSVNIHCGNLGGQTAKAALDQMFAPPLFPVTLDQLPAKFFYVGFEAGETLRFDDGIEVATCPLRHPGGATGYRFDYVGRRLCYVSDIEHVAPGPDEHLISFCAGADLVIYDAMFNEAEYQNYKGWGHSTWQAGVALCQASGARALAAYHHHKRHDDRMLAEIEGELAEALPGSFVARDGQSLLFAPVRADAAQSR